VPKRRFQKGCIRIVRKQWVLYYWMDVNQDGVIRRVKCSARLGAAKISSRAARAAAQPILDAVNHQADAPVVASRGLTLTDFVTEWGQRAANSYKPSTLRGMESSSSAVVFGAKTRPHRERKGKGSRLEVGVETPAYDLTIFKLHFGKLTLKVYTKGEHVLRFEAIIHNTKELGCGRRLERFPQIVARLQQILEQFLKIVRFPATMAASSRSSLHSRTPRTCPGQPERYTCIYKDGGTRTSSRRCLGSD
jgi:hypothetical protein